MLCFRKRLYFRVVSFSAGALLEGGPILYLIGWGPFCRLSCWKSSILYLSCCNHKKYPQGRQECNSGPKLLCIGAILFLPFLLLFSTCRISDLYFLLKRLCLEKCMQKIQIRFMLKTHLKSTSPSTASLLVRISYTRWSHALHSSFLRASLQRILYWCKYGMKTTDQLDWRG